MTARGTLLGTSVHDAAQRAADVLAILLPRVGSSGQPGERDALVAVLRAHGEPEPIEISDADLAGLRQAALDLQEVFAAGDVATAADRINALLGARAHPPRLTTHGGGSGWQGGLLGGVLKKEREGRRRLAGLAKQTVERNRERIAAYEDLCAELGEEPANVALAWLLHQEGVTGPIIGPRTLAQLDDAQRAVTLRLDDDVLKRLDDLFPGYRPAPEHYAW